MRSKTETCGFGRPSKWPVSDFVFQLVKATMACFRFYFPVGQDISKKASTSEYPPPPRDPGTPTWPELQGQRRGHFWRIVQSWVLWFDSQIDFQRAGRSAILETSARRSICWTSRFVNTYSTAFSGNLFRILRFFYPAPKYSSQVDTNWSGRTSQVAQGNKETCHLTFFSSRLIFHFLQCLEGNENVVPNFRFPCWWVGEWTTTGPWDFYLILYSKSVAIIIQKGLCSTQGHVYLPEWSFLRGALASGGPSMPSFRCCQSLPLMQFWGAG